MTWRDYDLRKINTISFFIIPWQHRKLIVRLSKREITARYRGSLLGLVWIFINPLLMLLIYTLFLGTFLKARWVNASLDSLSLSLVLFVGLNCYNFFADALNKAPGLLYGNINYIKKVIFPLEILPWVVISASLFQTTIAFLILAVFHWLTLGALPITSFCIIPLMLPFIMLTLGGIYFISSLSVYIKDTGHVLTFIMSALLFLSPIFYRIDSISPNLHYFLQLNPLTFIIEEARRCLLDGKMIHWGSYIKFSFVGTGVSLLGYKWFQITKIGFADVL